VNNISKAIKATNDTYKARFLNDIMKTTENTAKSRLFDDTIPADSHELML
jgi:hypothetical protein